MEFLKFNIQRDEVDRSLREVRMNWRANGGQSQGMLEEVGGVNEGSKVQRRMFTR